MCKGFLVIVRDSTDNTEYSNMDTYMDITHGRMDRWTPKSIGPI